jgi:hypothetical protein
MILKKKIQEKSIVVRCFNIISDDQDPKFGMECERKLLHKNSDGQVAGEIKCLRCHAVYDIKNGDLILINSGDKK